MSSTDWKVKSRRYLYKAKSPDEFNCVVDRVVLPSGNEFNYVYIDCPYEVVFIIGIDSNNRVLLINQHRYLINKEILEVPAGSPESGETLEMGAIRELEEEAGYRAENIIKIGSYYPAVGITNQINHIFLAFNLRETQQHLDESENISVKWMNFSDALMLAKEGKIENVGTAYGLLLAENWLWKNDFFKV